MQFNCCDQCYTKTTEYYLYSKSELQLDEVGREVHRMVKIKRLLTKNLEVDYKGDRDDDLPQKEQNSGIHTISDVLSIVV